MRGDGARDTRPERPADPTEPGAAGPGGPGGSGAVPAMAGPTEPGAATGRAGQLIAPAERDDLTERLRRAVNDFVDAPRRAVEEAEGVFEESARRLAEALAARRRTLREPWQGGEEPGHRTRRAEGQEVETEELRLALRQYRELTERLLSV